VKCQDRLKKPLTLSEDHRLDLKGIYTWTADTASFVDLVTSVHVYLESLVRYEQRSVDFIRDYAYASSKSEHFGRYPLTGSQPTRQVKALYDFNAQEEHELVFNAGDVIDVIFERSDGWILGMLNGISGLVPANHVETLKCE